jgi:hypothetical protein
MIDPLSSPRRRSGALLPALLALAVLVASPAALPAIAQDAPVGLLGPRRAAVVFQRELGQAWHAFGRSSLEEAEPLFRRVAEARAAPAGERCEALFGLAWCHAYRRPLPDTSGAIAVFTRITQEFPGDALTPWALIELGNLRVKKGQPKQEPGRKFYRQVLAQHPGSPAVHEAALRLANALLHELTEPEMQEGAALLERHLQEHPDNPLAVIMHFRLDYYYGDIRLDYEACLPHAIKVAELKLSDPFRWSRQYWHVAEILRLRLGRPAEAAHWYRRIVDECPTSMQAMAAAEHLAAIRKSLPAAGKGGP